MVLVDHIIKIGTLTKDICTKKLMTRYHHNRLYVMVTITAEVSVKGYFLLKLLQVYACKLVVIFFGFNNVHKCIGIDEEICPYATFHLLGFREEMDPSKAMQFQTFPHPHNTGTMGSCVATPNHHSRSGSQSMVKKNV